MSIDPDYLLKRQFSNICQSYSEKGCMLYALGVGLEEGPLDEECFRFVIEEDLKVVPSQAVMMAHSGFWEKEDDIGIDWLKLVHAGQEIIVHKPMPTSGTVEATT